MHRGRSNSVTSVGSGRFKDLLDAQEEIRSIDFRTRLEATGARDYGEDVADRNMRQNAIGDHGAFPPSVSTKLENTRPYLASQSGWSESSDFGHRTQSLTPSSQRSQHDFSFITRNRLDSPVPDTTLIKESANKGSVTRPNTNRFSIHTYTPTGLAFVNNPEFTTTHDGVRQPVLPSLSVEDASRPQRISPTGSNFSVPRSPKTNIVSSRTASQIPRTNFVSYDVDLANEEQNEEISTPTGTDCQPSLGSMTTHLPKATTTPILSNPNYRFSFASSNTSRHTSGDYTALDHPKILTHDSNEFSDCDGCHSQGRPSRKSVELRSRPTQNG